MISWRKPDVEWRIEYKKDPSYTYFYDYKIYNHRGKIVASSDVMVAGVESVEVKMKSLLEEKKAAHEQGQQAKSGTGWKVIT